VRDASTYIVVLDGEHDEPLRVLLEQRLILLLLLDRGRDSWLYRRVDLWQIGYADNGLENVLLVRGGLEVELLCGGIGHLEALNGRCSLFTRQYTRVKNGTWETADLFGGCYLDGGHVVKWMDRHASTVLSGSDV
jgi:hypothetical protein